MDAQNAAGPDTTKPPAAAAAASESKRPASELEQARPSTSATPGPAKPALAVAKPALSAAQASAGGDSDPKSGASLSLEDGDDKNATDGANSDAETIVLPGKDGHSPSKVRKVKHENKSDDERPVTALKPLGKDRERDSGIIVSLEKEKEKVKEKDTGNNDRGRDRDGAPGTGTGTPSSSLSQTLKKKRPHDSSSLAEKTPRLPPPDQRNNLNSKDSPTSPPPKRRKSNDANPHSRSNSDSETHRPRSPKTSKDRTKVADKHINANVNVNVKPKIKIPKVESDEEGSRKERRQRTAPASTGPSAGATESKHQPKDQQRPSKSHDHGPNRTRSVSPQARSHRRSASTQLPAQSQSTSSGLSQKKKRVPAPLQATEYFSDESSASGSPHPRSSKVRSLATPGTAESAVSPAKMGPHKKHLDAHGQTFLARACARGEFEQAKQRLAERPEDLNVADYAGNTPLQIAAINGCEDIVQLLIQAGCNLDCVNYDKDTPLLDAVDNGHLGVIKLLLDAGVNPRKANVNGEEPLDRVNEDMDNAKEIRAALVEARQRMGERRRTSEEHQTELDSRASHGPDSPRRSPAVTSHSNVAASRRTGTTVRATKTSNHLLYMPMDDKTLRVAAGKGDEETVTRILQVRDNCDDAEAMVNAARGGHDVVMQLLLALGHANPDPPPVAHMAQEVATPVLAAIGQENIKVIQLLLDQSNFDPTRKFKGEPYYSIARQRQGTNWKEEEHILKQAYDEYRKARSNDASKTKSPGRREREREQRKREDREAKRAKKEGGHKQSISSSGKDNEPRKKLVTAKPTTSSPEDKRRSESTQRDGRSSPKPASARLKKDDHIPTINVSDREMSPVLVKQPKPKRTESDMAAVSSEGETPKPRRKLVSKGELRGEREKQRRTSQASATAPLKDPQSPKDARTDDRPDKDKAKSEKFHDRTKALKRDESKDRLSVSGESTAKRHRSSATPPLSHTGDKDDSEVPAKKRRLDTEGEERRPKQASSAIEDRPLKRNRSQDPGAEALEKEKARKAKVAKARDAERKAAKRDAQRRESAKSTSSEKSIHVKCEDVDIEMDDAPPPPPPPPPAHREELESKVGEQKQQPDRERGEEEQEKRRAAEQAEPTAVKERKRREAEQLRARKEKEAKAKKEESESAAVRAKDQARQLLAKKTDEKAKRDALQAKRDEEKAKKEAEKRVAEKKRKEEEETKRKEEEELKKQAEEEELKRKAEEERKRKEEEEERKRVEAERKRQEDEERKRKEEEAAAAAAAEEKRRKEAEELKKKAEEEERKRKEEEERKRAEEAERARREEEERKRKAEEERRRVEEEARKKEEAEAEKRREEEKRLHREKMEREAAEAARRKREAEERREREYRERQRAAREAEARRLREEQEKARLAKLPALLRWLETCPNPKAPGIPEKFYHMQGVRYDTIRPEATGTPDGREQWVLNTQAALLLGDKDFALSRYTAWERIPVSNLAKKVLWRLEADQYALLRPELFDLGRQLPNYYGDGVDPERVDFQARDKLRREALDKFLKMDLFFVKLSDLMFTVSNTPHLRGIRLAVEYRELLENESQLVGWKVSQKWKSDPELKDRYHGFAPRNRYYVDGVFVGEEMPSLAKTSRTPFPEKKVPRRGGIQRVYPHDADYARLCKEQGLEHLLNETRVVGLPNGVQRNGHTPNGNGVGEGGGSPTSTGATERSPEQQQHRPLINGVNGGSSVGA